MGLPLSWGYLGATLELSCAVFLKLLSCQAAGDQKVKSSDLQKRSQKIPFSIDCTIFTNKLKGKDIIKKIAGRILDFEVGPHFGRLFGPPGFLGFSVSVWTQRFLGFSVWVASIGFRVCFGFRL